MGFCVIDLGDDKHDLLVNFWNWRPTVELIRSFGILDDERLELMHIQCVGASVGKLEARAIGEKIQKEVLPRLSEHSRVRLDLSTTEEPDDGTFHRDAEWEKNYSAQASWLKRFSLFCLTCEGFQVI